MMDWWTYEVCRSVPAASKQALTTTTQNHGTNNIHSHIDGYTSKSTSQVLLPLYKTIYCDVQNSYQFSNVYQNLLQKLKILWLCIAGKLHKTMNIKLLHTLPLVWRNKLRQNSNVTIFCCTKYTLKAFFTNILLRPFSCRMLNYWTQDCNWSSMRPQYQK